MKEDDLATVAASLCRGVKFRPNAATERPGYDE